PASTPPPPKVPMSAGPAPAAAAAANAQEEKTLFDLPSDLSQSRRKKPGATPAATPTPAAASAQQTTQVVHPLGRAIAAPAVRRFAREQGIDLQSVKGTGPHGRVLREDVQLFKTRGGATPVATTTSAAQPQMAAAPTAPALAAGTADERVPIRGLRKAIFENMVRSEAYAVPFTYWDEFDVTDLVKLRKEAGSLAEKQGVKLSYLPFIVKAVVSGLKQYPHLNAHMDEGARELVVRKDYHIGIAVATEKGLTVVVVKDCDKKSIFQIAKEIDALADKARAGKASMEDLKGSTFTITSLGKTGGLGATPVINHPEVAILGVHKLEARALVDEKRQVVVRDCMNLSGSFDHRVIDGHIAAEFVQHVGKLLSQPHLLLLGTA
ncbi:MAG TPA: dihydrolipoamide acetyltransferase family protein, partial [Candidatus Thermoplasmatota archaeon]|nr:dihydrolipoamide acetyltransferase family protein [Candidatus Thermoplasmatota archaeon]